MDVPVDNQHRWRYHDDRLARGLTALVMDVYSSGAAPDVRLLIKGKQYHCHKVILAESSDYFRERCYANNQDHMDINQVEQEIFEEIYRFMLTGTICINLESLHSILEACVCLKLSSTLKSFLEDILLANMSVHNCIEMMEYAGAFGCSRLQEQATDLARVNLGQLWNTESFQHLGKHDVMSVIGDPVDNDLSNKAFRHWVKYEPEFRQGIVQDRSSMYDVISDADEPQSPCNNYFSSNVFPSSPYENNNFPIEYVREKKTPELPNLCAVGYSSRDERPCGFVCRRQYHNTSYNKLNHFPKIGTRFACAMSGNRLYVSGGVNKQSDNVDKLDIAKNKWSQSPKLLCCRSGHAMTEIKGRLYVFGGFLGNETFTSIEEFDVSRHCWKFAGHLLTPTVSPAVIVENGLAYIFGGKSCRNTHSILVQCYNPREKTVMQHDSIPCSTSQVRVVQLQNDIYILSAKGEFFRYNITSRQCSSLSCLSKRRKNFGMACDNENVFVFGGKLEDGSILSDIQVYDVDTSTWSEGKRLPFPMDIIGCCPLDK